jgi:hypothetical protein
MCEEETKGGASIKLGEPNPCRKETEKATQSRESDPCVERRWNREGGRVSRLAPHGRVAANLGFDNQTLFCHFLGF